MTLTDITELIRQQGTLGTTLTQSPIGSVQLLAWKPAWMHLITRVEGTLIHALGPLWQNCYSLDSHMNRMEMRGVND
jgi:hypothetical protein